MKIWVLFKNCYNSYMNKILGLLLLLFFSVSAGFCASIWKISFDDYKDSPTVDGFRFVSGQWQLKSAKTPSGKINKFLSQDQSSVEKSKFSVALFESAGAISDGIFYARIRLGGGKVQSAGLVLKYKSPSDFIYVALSQTNKTIGVYQFDGAIRELAKGKTNLEPGQWAGVRVFVRGARVKVELNSAVALQFSNPAFSGSGSIGFFTLEDTTADFDNVIVAPLSVK